MSLAWTLHGSGWAECTVADQNGHARMAVSYVTDAPEEFLTAVARIITGADDARVDFEAEPTGYRWILRRRGSHVDIQLLELRDRFEPDNTGTLIWASRPTADALARVVVRAFDAVRVQHGEDGYETAWRRPFPTFELNALRTVWRDQNPAPSSRIALRRAPPT